jgi:hypothetical protein
MSDRIIFLAEAFALAINDYNYHPLNEDSNALTTVSNLKLYRGVSESVPVENDSYEHPHWQMWTTNKELAKMFADGPGRKGLLLEMDYSGQCVDLEKVYFQVLKDIEDKTVDLVSYPEIGEALDTYRSERDSFILPPSAYKIVKVNSDTSTVIQDN